MRTTLTANPSHNYLQLDPLLKLDAVKGATGLSRSALYRKVAAGEFPAPVRLGAHAVAWRTSEVAAWIASRVTTVRSAKA